MTWGVRDGFEKEGLREKREERMLWYLTDTKMVKLRADGKRERKSNWEEVYLIPNVLCGPVK